MICYMVFIVDFSMRLMVVIGTKMTAVVEIDLGGVVGTTISAGDDELC